MKKLFMMVALSLVMVACDKEEENELSYWDKVTSEIGETKLSVTDVLKSLRDNEYWDTKIQYDYYSKDGKVVENIVIGEGVLASGNPTAMRFADDKMYSYYSAGPADKGCIVYDVEETTDGIIFSEEGYDSSKWKVIAYDENQVLVESYPLIKQQPTAKGEYLYSKVLKVRKVDNTKWWEDAK